MITCPTNFLFGSSLYFFYTPMEWWPKLQMINSKQRKKSFIFAKTKKRLPKRTSNPFLWNKNEIGIGKMSEKVTYENHF